MQSVAAPDWDGGRGRGLRAAPWGGGRGYELGAAPRGGAAPGWKGCADAHMRPVAAPWGGAEPGRKGCADAHMRSVAAPPGGADPGCDGDASAACAGMRRPAGFSAHLWWSQSSRMIRTRGSALGQATGHRGRLTAWHWGRQRVIGVGNGALEQVNSLPQCGLACPNTTRGARDYPHRRRGEQYSPEVPHYDPPHFRSNDVGNVKHVRGSFPYGFDSNRSHAPQVRRRSTGRRPRRLRRRHYQVRLGGPAAPQDPRAQRHEPAPGPPRIARDEPPDHARLVHLQRERGPAVDVLPGPLRLLHRLRSRLLRAG